MANSKSIKKKIWPALSTCTLVGFLNLATFICIEKYFSYFSLFAVLILSIIIIPMVSIFLELTGIRKRIWKYWSEKIKFYVHQLISMICLFWIFSLSFKCLLPLTREMYDGRKN